ncbi:unnamed protein product [Caretta caretta]
MDLWSDPVWPFLCFFMFAQEFAFGRNWKEYLDNNKTTPNYEFLHTITNKPRAATSSLSVPNFSCSKARRAFAQLCHVALSLCPMQGAVIHRCVCRLQGCDVQNCGAVSSLGRKPLLGKICTMTGAEIQRRVCRLQGCDAQNCGAVIGLRRKPLLGEICGITPTSGLLHSSPENVLRGLVGKLAVPEEIDVAGRAGLIRTSEGHSVSFSSREVGFPGLDRVPQHSTCNKAMKF